MLLRLGSVSMREKIVTEMDTEEELKQYKKNKEWYAECQQNFFEWYERMNKDETNKELKKVKNAYCNAHWYLNEVIMF